MLRRLALFLAAVAFVVAPVHAEESFNGLLADLDVQLSKGVSADSAESILLRLKEMRKESREKAELAASKNAALRDHNEQIQKGLDERMSRLEALVRNAISNPAGITDARAFIKENRYEPPMRLLRAENFQPSPLRTIGTGGTVVSGASGGRFSLPPDAGYSPPNGSDMAEGSGTEITDAIKAKAAELGNDAVAIREFLHNEIEFYPTFGQVQGADHTLKTKCGNAFDIASLGVALYRAAGIPARFVYGVIEMEPERFVNWMGMEDTYSALLLATEGGGLPVTTVMSGGQIVKIRMEHVWVAAFIPYGDYQGSKTDRTIGSTKQWVHVDGAFKFHDRLPATDLSSDAPFDLMGYLDNAGEVVPPLFYHMNRATVAAQIRFGDTATVMDASNFRLIKEERVGFIPQSERYDRIKILAVFPHLTAELQFHINIAIPGSGLSYSRPMPELAGKSINIIYEPATDRDRQTIATYGGIYATPPHLVSIVPVLLINEVPVAKGGLVSLGADQTLDVEFKFPVGLKNDASHHQIVAGEYYGLGLEPYKVSTDDMVEYGALIKDAVAKNPTLGDSGFANVNIEVASRLLFATASAYWYQLEAGEQLIDQMLWTRHIKQPASALFALSVKVDHQFNVPSSVKVTGITVDVSRNVYAPYPVRGDMQKRAAFMELALANASYYEARVLNEKLRLPAQSTVTLFNHSRRNNQPLYTFTKENRHQYMPLLGALPQSIRDEFISQTNLGNEIVTPTAPYAVDGFNGVAYIVRDPKTFAGGYMIGSGQAGGITLFYPGTTAPVPGQWNKRASFCFGRVGDIYSTAQLAQACGRYAYLFALYGFVCKAGAAYDMVYPDKAAYPVQSFARLKAFLSHADGGGYFFYTGHSGPDLIVPINPGAGVGNGVRWNWNQISVDCRLVFIAGCNSLPFVTIANAPSLAASFGIDLTDSSREAVVGFKQEAFVDRAVYAGDQFHYWLVNGNYLQNAVLAADYLFTLEDLYPNPFVPLSPPLTLGWIGDGHVVLNEF